MIHLNIITTASLALITIGAAVMFTNIVNFRKLMLRLKKFDAEAYGNIQRRSLLPLLFILFFFLGYLFIVYALFNDLHIASTFLVGVVFFFGALFVFVSTRFQSQTITHLWNSHKRLEHESLHDRLTGLSNRSLFHNQLQQTINRCSRTQGSFYSVLFLDLDRFKNVNDSLGHETGDEVLVEVAKRLLACVRNVDTVSRFSGAEFVILLDGTSPRRTIKVVQRIRKRLSEPFHIRQHSLNITVSTGIYYGPTKIDQPYLVMQNAHLALQKAKKLGPGRFKVFRSAMLAHAVEAMALEHALLRGIRNKEFVAHYQPVISLNEPPVLLGFEALARWNHPSKGQVSPLTFIPLAEETGLIKDIGAQIFSQACQTRKRLADTIPGMEAVHMAVNISMLQISHAFFDRQFMKITAEHDIKPQNVTLEVTESTIMEQEDMAISRLTRLRELGFSIAIDDFGTGYSSFAYLKDLPATHVKIDRAFVRNMVTNKSDKEIIKSMIVMGHSLFMTVVAEGVEDKEQLDLLREFGCDCVQGFYYSKPLPPEKVEDFVREFQRKHNQEQG